MISLLNEAAALEPYLIALRRDLHRHPELGRHEFQTAQRVERELRALGLQTRRIAGTGVIGFLRGKSDGPCIALRADMDALPIQERCDSDFSSECPGVMHACGHDMHTAALIGAAGLLARHRSELRGSVKFLFQPDEEGFTGAKAMLAAGILKKKPEPQAALALHVHSGTPSGLALCGRGTFIAGCTLFRITVQGIGCHGAMPETGVDPINIAAHIYLALQELIARELAAKTPAVVTIGRFCGGEGPNIIPGACVLEGTIRTFDREVTARLMTRITELAEGIAKAFRGSARTEELASAPPLKNDPALVNRMADWAEELLGKQSVYRLDEGGMGSEDFASYTYEVPSAYLLLGAGTAAEDPRFGKPMHNPQVVFNEDILPKGAALYAACAMKWLAKKPSE